MPFVAASSTSPPSSLSLYEPHPTPRYCLCSDIYRLCVTPIRCAALYSVCSPRTPTGGGPFGGWCALHPLSTRTRGGTWHDSQQRQYGSAFLRLRPGLLRHGSGRGPGGATVSHETGFKPPLSRRFRPASRRCPVGGHVSSGGYGRSQRGGQSRHEGPGADPFIALSPFPAPVRGQPSP